jgi:hypothetical protein
MTSQFARRAFFAALRTSFVHSGLRNRPALPISEA